MVEESFRRPFPFIHAKADEDSEPRHKGTENACIGPGICLAAETDANEGETQGGGKQRIPWKIEMAQLLPESKMVESRVPLGRTISEQYAESSGSPKTHLNPLDATQHN